MATKRQYQRPAGVWQYSKGDRWGGYYRDKMGFFYRDPRYKPRATALLGQDTGLSEMPGGWFKSDKRKFVKTTLEKLAAATEQLTAPITKAIFSPRVLIAVAAGVGLYLLVKRTGDRR